MTLRRCFDSVRRVLSFRSPIAGLAVSSLVLAACGGGGGPQRGAPPTSVRLLAGSNDPKDLTVAALAFLPSSITVAEGTTVHWTFPGPEPHTVSFVPQGQEVPGPDSPQATAPKAPSGPYAGTSFVSSGILPRGPQPGAFSIRFSKTGSYLYHCLIHPGMEGNVRVVPKGQQADTQQQLDSRAQQEKSKWFAEGEAAKQGLVSKAARSEKNADGSTTWYVEMGTGTAHTAVLAFAPTPVEAKPGDTVVFVNNSNEPHTATFAGKQQTTQNPESAEAMRPAPGKSPQTLNATDFFNTGWLPPNVPPGQGPPEAARSFTFVIPKAGTYGFVCLLHAPSKMVGQIRVG